MLMFLDKMYIIQKGDVPLLANFHYKTLNNFIKSVLYAYLSLGNIEIHQGEKLT